MTEFIGTATSHDNIQKEFAFWAVESWALALYVIQSPLAQKIITPEPRIIVPPKRTPIVSTSPQQQIGKFIVQDGIATNPETGLMCLRFAYGQRWDDGKVVGYAEELDWDDAMDIPDTFNQQGYAGYKDWRVPTIDELLTLIDEAKGTKGNCINENVFPKNDAWLFWSSSPNANNSNYAWYAYFGYDHSNYNHKDNYYNVRLVRG